MRWKAGIAGLIGESFAEIFFGNCVALGVTCVCAANADVQALKRRVEADPQLEVTIDLEAMQARAGSLTIPITMPDGARRQLRSGRWDSSAELLEGTDRVAKTASALPYFRHWA
jgi:3-isopropylmalate/(R)-2-methylmalate dehydratase small subunit